MDNTEFPMQNNNLAEVIRLPKKPKKLKKTRKRRSKTIKFLVNLRKKLDMDEILTLIVGIVLAEIVYDSIKLLLIAVL